MFQREDRSARAGVTLLELVLVMAILATVLGVGVGLFAALDVSKRATLGELKGVLRAARTSATAQGATTRVRIDAENGLVWAELLHTVGTWHFEGDLNGAFGHGGVLRDGAYLDDGYIGKALGFWGQPGSRAEIPLNQDPAFELRDGFRFTAAIQNDGGGRLLEVGRTFQVDLNAAGSVRASFTAELLKDGAPQPGGQVVAQTEVGVLRPGRWSLLEIVYDRVALRILVDGLEVAQTAESAPVWKVDDPLTLGSSRRPYNGAIDCLVVAVAVPEEPVALPVDARFDAGTLKEIVFEAAGGLDRRVHPEPVFLHVDFEDGTRETVSVGTFGTVEG